MLYSDLTECICYFKYHIKLRYHKIWYWKSWTHPLLEKKPWAAKGMKVSAKIRVVTGVNKSPSPTPGASNFHIWASWNNQLYARLASKNIYRILTNLSIFAYLLIFIICYMLFNQQQCFIYSTASFLSKLRAKKVEKLCILVIKRLTENFENEIPESDSGNDYFRFCR